MIASMLRVDSSDRPLRWLGIIALLQAALYGVLAWLSGAFAYGTVPQQRPILAMLALLAIGFLLYLLAIRVATRCPASRRLTWTIVGSALAFRLLLVASHPIQEIDIYRYLWDGAVTAQGMNPYRFAPDQILAAEAGDGGQQELQQLLQLRDGSAVLAEILGRIHFADLTTIYPPVSQAVFAATYAVTPRESSVVTRVTIQKAVLVLFDLGTVGLVWLLLRRMAMHPGLLVVYAWCPLVIKEIANSGHHDAIAVFLSVAAIACVVQLGVARWLRLSNIAWGAILLGLAVGAKLYPIVLLPLLSIWVIRGSGLAAGGRFVAIALAAVLLCTAPMLWAQPGQQGASSPNGGGTRPPATAVASVEPTGGLQAFLTQWEMNDFLFLILFENLRPIAGESNSSGAWFAMLPDDWRRAAVEPIASRLDVGPTRAAFLVARAVTLGVFGAIAAGLAGWVWRAGRLTAVLEGAFLTIAWFWLLSPTQNPWYWVWALPLLPFARGRAWLLLSGLVLVYYLRFWLQYHYHDVPVLGTPYAGNDFFDLVVTWLEYAPWFAWLVIGAWLRKKGNTVSLAGTGASVLQICERFHGPNGGRRVN